MPKALSIVTLGLLSFGSPSAHAYLDPGTGSLIIQGLVATVAAIGFTTRIYWHRLKNIFRRDKDKDVEKTEIDQDSSN